MRKTPLRVKRGPSEVSRTKKASPWTAKSRSLPVWAVGPWEKSSPARPMVTISRGAGSWEVSKLAVRDFVQRLSRERGVTVILTTHLMEIADKLSDRVAVIDHGKLLVVDPPERLKDTVGTGDVLEIHLTDENKVSDAIGAIETVEGIDSAAPVDGVIAVRALDMVGKLQRLFNTLEERKIEISNVSLRKNTLEDVFITLTGRGLREG